MLYPSIGQYTEAIKLAEQSPEDYFATMTTLRPILGADGNPVMSSGNFAVVFKMQDQTDGKIYALKCFTRDQEGRNESYRLIADELKDVFSPYITNIQYLENELFVDTGTDDTEFPVLLMDWVEGETLDKYIKNHINEPACLNLLVGRFGIFADWLLKQPFAHGDLKPDNIIVKDDGSLVIVDYDGMYVPKMRGQKARELGSPDFRHPQRTEDDFDEHIDDFAIVTLLLTIKAIALNPNILEDCNAKDCVLLHTQDFTNLAQSIVNQKLQELIGDSDFARLYAVFVVVLAEGKIEGGLKMLWASVSIVKLVENNATEVSDEEIENGIEDESGVVYSKDGKRLLRCNNFELKEYQVKEGTKVICDNAFDDYRYNLHNISIPNSVVRIGKEAFANCIFLKSISIPKGVVSIGSGFIYGTNIESIKCQSDNFEVDNNILYFKGRKILHTYFGNAQHIDISETVSNIWDGAFWECRSLQSISIPKNVVRIGNKAFKCCTRLKNITLSDGVTSIGEYAFGDCRELKNISIPNTVISIGNYAFAHCESLQSIQIPDGVHKVSDGTFRWCKSLQQIRLSNSVNSIEKLAFDNCKSLQNISLPSHISKIGDGAFRYCVSLRNIIIPKQLRSIGSGFIANSGVQSIISHSDFFKVDYNTLYSVFEKKLHTYFGHNTQFYIPKNVVKIENRAFEGCKTLENIVIPEDVSDIGVSAFEGCSHLKKISIPNSVTRLKYATFRYCTSLHCISIPQSVSHIDDNVFVGCRSLQNITIPNNVTNIGNDLFLGCDSLQNFIIPNNVTSIGNSAFGRCKSLKDFIVPRNVKSIGCRVFAFCESLQSVTFLNSSIAIGENVFEKCINLNKIIVPRQSLTKFRKMVKSKYSKLLTVDNNEPTNGTLF